jgi:uncharacterized protein (DUF779 family)
MRLLSLSLLSMLSLVSACGGNKNGAACSLTAKDARPQVPIVWHVDHGSMDDDPPRPRVKVTVGKDDVDVGELAGVCKLVEVGAQLEDPVYGSKVTELGCLHGGRGTYATLFLDAPGKLTLRRWERAEGGDGALEKVRELRVLEVPRCAVFTSEIAQGGGL